MLLFWNLLNSWYGDSKTLSHKSQNRSEFFWINEPFKVCVAQQQLQTADVSGYWWVGFLTGDAVNARWQIYTSSHFSLYWKEEKRSHAESSRTAPAFFLPRLSVCVRQMAWFLVVFYSQREFEMTRVCYIYIGCSLSTLKWFHCNFLTKEMSGWIYNDT